MGAKRIRGRDWGVLVRTPEGLSHRENLWSAEEAGYWYIKVGNKINKHAKLR